MKLRADFVQLYRDVHSWVGVIAGLFLFVAFYAGSITMFEEPLQYWASSPVALPPPVSLEHTPDLLQKVLAAYPEARTDYTITVAPQDGQNARVTWGGSGGQAHRAPTPVMAAGLDGEGSLIVVPKTDSDAAHFIDVLHQQVGLPLPHTPAMVLMGLVALLYTIALVSGVIAYLPALFKTLFAVRLGQSVRKRWLDLHNLLGLFSLPFHLVMAVSSVVFAFHDQIFTVEHLLFARPVAARHGGVAGSFMVSAPTNAAPTLSPVLAPTDILALMARQAPGFVPETLNYRQLAHGRDVVRVFGHDARYPTRGPTGGFVVLNAHTGAVQSGEYMPGHQPVKFSILTSFFALHFGSYGGMPVRCGYVLLGLGGAFLFYTGNQLWIVSRRRRERQNGAVVETRGTKFLAALTSGCIIGCVAGLSAVFCAVPVLPSGGTYSAVSTVYYSVFCLFVVTAFCLPGQRGVRFLLAASGVVTACVPFMLCLHGAYLLRITAGAGVAVMACLLSLFLFVGAMKHTREL
ncbi:PepSY-associated TM helix domain-containing protein [Acetobacter orleanensis]|uniref:Peptidase n=1 Tax=Acetobacter orleanensis TaxID=104099 RepID=A0A4Y3TIS4_9PROT|nr:PepSY-associated TM helix domain-containing protein [Acetobacter orleanensis]KXV63925.1 hypothetical protein AD949_06365 [Acetobacter orleanensis]PCD79696.1 PepSY domain-containing protein [Acetobacter orleanensis]GAN69258.1 hypothetical protein Abol_030_023 [Acetobacter orleanensis JCM 7639]GBR28204.1 hypothetical protein AA0473_1673 [Acetobacter orleanensis NRIC 0473]GEB82216.1 peptidase [Acetobacter orleanensis]